MEERKSFFGTPLRAFIFIVCVAAVISVFIIGTVFATMMIVRNPSNRNERTAAENESETAEGEYSEIQNGSVIPDAAEADLNVGMDEAKTIAVEHAGFSVSEVNFSKAKLEKEHRMVVYEIEFYKDGVEYEYEIDAGSGEIIKYESDWDD